MVSMRKIFIGFILLFIGVFPAFAGKNPGLYFVLFLTGRKA